MRRMKKWLGLFMVGCLAATAVIAGSAAPAQAEPLLKLHKDPTVWDIPQVGKMQGPEGFRAVDIVDWAKEYGPLLDKVKPPVPSGKPPVQQLTAKADETPGNAKESEPVKASDAGKEQAKKPAVTPDDFHVYQLQVNDGKAYHLAFAFVARDTKPAFPEWLGYFSSTLTDEQKKKLDENNSKIQLGIAMMQTEFAKSGLMTLNVLDFKPIQRLKGAPEVIYTVGGRAILDMRGLVGPFYGKCYLLSRGGKTVAVGLFTTDAEAAFWEKTLDRMIVTLSN